MRIAFNYLFLFLLMAGCNDSNPSEPQGTTSKQRATQVSLGEDVYLMYCAQCHGATGDGTASIALDRPARSFIDGGFSFGNTEYAIAKTTASGIPGTPMPPFIEVLTQDEINAVSKHVRSFAPTIPSATADEMEMIVSDTPLVARGMLPPIQNDLPLHPRGVVIGNPDRFSYEYAADDVRLLSIRQGKFVNRSDWRERGGSPLELLGQIVTLVDNNNPGSFFETIEGAPLRGKLIATNTNGKYATISYDLIGKEGQPVASVIEHCQPTTGVRTLIEQRFIVEAKIPILISPPKSAILVREKELPKGITDFKLIHGSVEGSR